MSNIRHIKVYDDFISLGVVDGINTSYMASNNKHKNIHAFINDETLPKSVTDTWEYYDSELFQAMNKAYISYITDYPNMVGNYTTELNDIGYHFKEITTQEELRSDVTGLYDCAKVVKIIMFLGDEGSIEFPYDGLNVSAKPGRIVMFPSSWNLKYKLQSNENSKIIETSMIYAK